MELHFFPGVHVLAIKSNNIFTSRFEAWGGPSTMGSSTYMPEEPTWPGIYVIHSSKAYTTPTWTFSKIKWGTRLMDKPSLNDIYYELPSKKWGSIKSDLGASRQEILDLYFSYYGVMKIPPTWVFNDFGPISIRWFKDVNGNKTLDAGETLSGQMFHTTPQNEAEQANGKKVNLAPSHGCIHLKPADRNTIFGLGGFKPKTTFVVHEYHEKI